MDYNELLGITHSDDDGASDHDDDFKHRATEGKGYTIKRSRTAESHGSDNRNSDNEHGEKQSRTDLHVKRRNLNREMAEAASSEEDNRNQTKAIEQDIDLAPSTTTKSLEEKTKPRKAPKSKKRGVIYFSSLPPYLKPRALKNLLQARGFEPITRIFLTPLMPSDSRQKGNKRKTYSDGWVEFASKKTAKICAETLNARTIGGRGYYRDDLLNVKYLHKFGWDDLMEQVQRERSEREAKRRIEDAQARKEQKMYLENVEAGRAVQGMARKREEKQRALTQGSKDDMAAKAPDIRRRFVQNTIITREREDGRPIGEDTKRVLATIF